MLRRRLFGILTQIDSGGRPGPVHFPDHAEQLHHRHRQPGELQSARLRTSTTSPPNTRWPYIQSWFFSVQRELTKNTVLEVGYNGNHSLRLPIIADYNQARTCPPHAIRRRDSGCLGVQARRPIPTFGPITWLDPAGNNNYNGLSARVEHRFGARPVLPEFVHVVEGAGRFRAGAGVLTPATTRRIRRTFAIWRRSADPPAST